MDHADKALRPVYPARFAYPRFVGYDHGPVLHPSGVETDLYPWYARAPSHCSTASPAIASTPYSFALAGRRRSPLASSLR
jgi:hypothetical protein